MDTFTLHRDDRRELAFTPEVEAETAPIYERLAHVMPRAEFMAHAPYIAAINRLKRKKNAVILAHNYQTPEIFHGVADITGDSLQLARDATKVEADIIVMCGVNFMADTAKLLNPSRTVLLPDTRAGCSLAASVSAADIRLIKQRYPGVPVVSYVNTSAEVKAESDICCTSSNALDVVNSLGVERVIMLPDRFLARYVAAQTEVEVIEWAGSCEVHERFSAEEIADLRESHPGVVVLAHPECPEDVLSASDYVGSTAQMTSYVEREQPRQVVLITECSMSDNVAAANPGVDFVRPCNLCPHMKRITLPNILDALERGQYEVVIPDEIAARAVKAVERMLAVPVGAAAQGRVAAGA